MACYISTRNSRYYAVLESEFGRVAAVTAANRFSGVWLNVMQRWEEPRRRDKTGTRTFQGVAGRLRKHTAFALTTYLYAREAPTGLPRCGPLVECALGSAPRVTPEGLPVTQVQGTLAVFGAAHGLRPGDAITFGGDLRFVTACPDPLRAWLSAPLTGSAGMAAGGAVSYRPAAKLPSASLYEYWTPESAVQRILRGCVVDELELELNGDFHQLTFRGEAVEVVDSASFEPGQGGLSSFPAEPELQPLMELPVPGHLGQVWIGNSGTMLGTVASARIRIRNHVEMRWRDFGLLAPRCAAPGDREVRIDLEIYSSDNEVCEAIHASADRREPMALMVQMGETPGAMCGIHVANFVPSPPEFLDGEERLRWRLRGCQAQGFQDDEIYLSFG